MLNKKCNLYILLLGLISVILVASCQQQPPAPAPDIPEDQHCSGKVYRAKTSYINEFDFTTPWNGIDNAMPPLLEREACKRAYLKAKERAEREHLPQASSYCKQYICEEPHTCDVIEASDVAPNPPGPGPFIGQASFICVPDPFVFDIGSLCNVHKHPGNPITGYFWLVSFGSRFLCTGPCGCQEPATREQPIPPPPSHPTVHYCTCPPVVGKIIQECNAESEESCRESKCRVSLPLDNGGIEEYETSCIWI